VTSAGGSGSSSANLFSSASPEALFAARVAGATAGVTRSSNGQSVFASSVAPKGAAQSAGGGSASERSAARDLWGGFSSKASAPGSGSVASAAPAQGAGSFGVGMGILSLGLAGTLGTALVGMARRRRAEVKPSSRSGGEAGA
jgi:hypothetical protein